MKLSSRSLVVAAVTAAAVSVSGTALASWPVSGIASGSATATTLQPPTAGTHTTTPSTVTLNWNAAAGTPAPTGYTVLRTAPTVCTNVSATTCADSGLTPSTLYTYTVRSLRGAWSSVVLTTQATTTTAFAITSNTLSGNKVTLSGTGSSGSTTITVVVCKINSFPCPAGSNTEATLSVATPSAGAWGPTTLSGTITNNVTHYAQATQGSVLSAIYAFAT